MKNNKHIKDTKAKRRNENEYSPEKKKKSSELGEL